MSGVADIGGVVIVGASVAGVAAADGLRSNGFEGPVTLLEAERHPPYDKPPLSKAALDPGWDAARGLLRSDEHFAEKRVDLRLGARVDQLHGAERVLTLKSGERLRADHVVLAPGLRARRFRWLPDLPGVHTIRTRDDSDAVRAALARRPRVVVVGGGFIGAETASVAAGMGLSVTVVEIQALPFQNLFGAEVAGVLAGWHRDAGVELATGVGVRTLHGDQRGVEGVELADGRVIPADLVILGLGGEPAIEWLAGSGVEVREGIVCDEHGRSSVPRVWAAGDAAEWRDPATGLSRRIEHWTTAKEQGAAVAHAIVRPDEAPRELTVPYFWSDQHGTRLQSLGSAVGHDDLRVVHGDLSGGPFVVVFLRDQRVIAALGAGATRELMRLRDAVASSQHWETFPQ